MASNLRIPLESLLDSTKTEKPFKDFIKLVKFKSDSKMLIYLNFNSNRFRVR